MIVVASAVTPRIIHLRSISPRQISMNSGVASRANSASERSGSKPVCAPYGSQACGGCGPVMPGGGVNGLFIAGKAPASEAAPDGASVACIDRVRHGILSTRAARP